MKKVAVGRRSRATKAKDDDAEEGNAESSTRVKKEKADKVLVKNIVSIIVAEVPESPC